MSSLKIDKYFDITCCVCGFSRSTDYEYGLETNATRLRRTAKQEGWKTVRAEDTNDGTEGTLCPSCAAKCKYINCSPPCGDKCDCDLCTATGYCEPALSKAMKVNPRKCFRLYPGV